MPRKGMETVRRAALIDAAIGAIAEDGSGAVTVAKIARRAGVSAPLAHHYFGSKDAILLAAMRHILRALGSETAAALRSAETPLGRVHAIVHASFSPTSFRPEIVAAWLDFYVAARTDPAVARLLRVYQGRLRSNLTHALRPLSDEAPRLAEGTAALIDGVWLRAALGEGGQPATLVTRWIEAQL